MKRHSIQYYINQGGNVLHLRFAIGIGLSFFLLIFAFFSFLLICFLSNLPADDSNDFLPVLLLLVAMTVYFLYMSYQFYRRNSVKVVFLADGLYLENLVSKDFFSYLEIEPLQEGIFFSMTGIRIKSRNRKWDFSYRLSNFSQFYWQLFDKLVHKPGIENRFPFTIQLPTRWYSPPLNPFLSKKIVFTEQDIIFHYPFRSNQTIETRYLKKIRLVNENRSNVEQDSIYLEFQKGQKIILPERRIFEFGYCPQRLLKILNGLYDLKNI